MTKNVEMTIVHIAQPGTDVSVLKLRSGAGINTLH